MDLEDPVVAYVAENNIEAAFLADMLVDGGVRAHAQADESVVGLWAFGKLPQVHKPRIWIARQDQERAAPLLSTFERQKVARSKHKPVAGDETLDVVCEECAKVSVFPRKLEGTVQECRNCRAHVDVGDFDWPYDAPEGADVAEP